MDLSPLSKVLPSWDSPTLQGFDLTDVQPGERIKGSARQYVRFYYKTFVEAYATDVKVNERGTTQVVKTATREITKEMVHIITPGDKNEVDDVACDFHKREHWREYKAFRDGKTAPLGISLDDCGDFVSPHMATELKYRGCHTLEQLADASDLLCGNIANGWELREFARAKVKANKSAPGLEQVNLLKSALEASNKLIADLQAQMKMLLDARGMPIAHNAGAIIAPALAEVPVKKTWSRKKKVPVTQTPIETVTE